MCGIFGYFDRSGAKIETGKILRMGETLRHRGPDDAGIFEGRASAVGNQRLSIIDVAQGHQPFMSEDRRIAVVQNGEIYNYVELAKELARDGFPCRTTSDTEVILRLYERDGVEFAHRLNGMFAIAILDQRDGCLHLIRDRLGVKPLYYWDNGKRILFASEIKAILEMGVAREPSYEAMSHYLSFNYVPPPLTLFQGVRHLMPGSRMQISSDRVATHEWWRLSEVEPSSASEAAWVSGIQELLEDSVRLRIRSDVPFGAFLSGGIDSSAVVGLMSKIMSEPVKSFTIGFEDPRYDESEFARQSAARFGTQHRCEIAEPGILDRWPTAVYHCDQPHGDVSFIPTHRLAELARTDVKMVLTGDGGDELFAGYEKYQSFFASPASRSEDFEKAYFESISLFGESSKGALFPAGQNEISSLELARGWFSRVKDWDPINRALFLDTVLLLPGNNLVKPDRMAMAVSLEAREPLLDYRLVELAFRIPGSLKLKDGQTKHIFKKAVEPLLGKEIIDRKKQMFTVPIGEWLRKDYSWLAREALLGERSRERGILEPAIIESLLQSHLDGRANHTREIRALIALELWFRTFIDQLAGGPPSFESLGFTRKSRPS